jgi:hypothetical protein
MVNCEQLIDDIVAAIDDEVKAQTEYHKMAQDAEIILCGAKCPNGPFTSESIKGIAKDESKHENLLVELLNLMRKTKCPLEQVPMRDNEARLGLRRLFGD